MFTLTTFKLGFGISEDLKFINLEILFDFDLFDFLLILDLFNEKELFLLLIDEFKDDDDLFNYYLL
jgi:hypothetical protein